MVYRCFADTLVFDSLSVIFDFYVDVIAPMVRANRNVAVIRFAGAISLFRTLQSVRNSIANKMNQWIRDLLDDAVVEFCFSAGQVQFDQLPCRFRSIPHCSGDTGLKVPNWNHSRLGNFVLQPMGETSEFVDVGVNSAHKSIELRENLTDVSRDFR